MIVIRRSFIINKILFSYNQIVDSDTPFFMWTGSASVQKDPGI